MKLPLTPANSESLMPLSSEAAEPPSVRYEKRTTHIGEIAMAVALVGAVAIIAPLARLGRTPTALAGAERAALVEFPDATQLADPDEYFEIVARDTAPRAPHAKTLGYFDVESAHHAIGAATIAAKSCPNPDRWSGLADLFLTFAPTGEATNVRVPSDVADLAVGSCIVASFRSATVSPFAGGAVTITKSLAVY